MNTEELNGLKQERCNQAMRRGQDSDSASSLAWTPPPLDREIYPELAQAYTFLPGLVEHYLARQELPIKRELAVLFVDLADSTNAVLRRSPEMALAAVQRFMRVVTEITLAHCGDVKDYEGDGALLYFASVAAAARAALAIQAALAAERSTPDTCLQARLSLNVGEVVIGVIGSPLRPSPLLINHSIRDERIAGCVSVGVRVTAKAEDLR